MASRVLHNLCLFVRKPNQASQRDNSVLHHDLPCLQSFLQHMELGIKAAANDPTALLIFSGGPSVFTVVFSREKSSLRLLLVEGIGSCVRQSHAMALLTVCCVTFSFPLRSGGQTRAGAGARSEAQSYRNVAQARGWFGHPNVQSRAVTEVGASRYASCWLPRRLEIHSLQPWHQQIHTVKHCSQHVVLVSAFTRGWPARMPGGLDAETSDQRLLSLTAAAGACARQP